jgi:hypothetical protein
VFARNGLGGGILRPVMRVGGGLVLATQARAIIAMSMKRFWQRPFCESATAEAYSKSALAL